MKNIDGDITWNDIMGAVSTALSIAGIAFSLAGFWHCCMCCWSCFNDDKFGKTVVIDSSTFKNGHNVYVYISSNIIAFV